MTHQNFYDVLPDFDKAAPNWKSFFEVSCAFIVLLFYIFSGFIFNVKYEKKIKLELALTS